MLAVLSVPYNQQGQKGEIAALCVVGRFRDATFALVSVRTHVDTE